MSSACTTSSSTTLPPYKVQSKLNPTDHATDPHAPLKTPQRSTRSAGAAGPSLASELSVDNISFGEVRTNNETGRKTVYVNYDNQKFPWMQTPWLSSWGIESSAKFADSSNAGAEPKLSMSLTLDKCVCESSDAEAEVDAFTEFMHGLETKLVDMGCSRSRDLFKKRALDEVTVREAMFVPLVRISEKGVKRFKVHFSNYNPASVFGEDLNEVPPDQWEAIVTGRMKVRALIECRPMWSIMSSNKFGCKWEVRQLQFAPLSTTLPLDTYLFDTGKVPTEVDVGGITFSDLKVDSRTNVKKILLNAPTGGPLRFQTPWMNSYDGIAPPAPEYVKEGDAPKYSVKWSLKGDGETETRMRDWLASLDEHVLDHAEAHSQQLFKKKMSKEVLRALHTPLLKEEHPSLKVSAPIYNGIWGFAAYDETGAREETNLHEKVTGRMQCRAILQCKGMWFSGGRSFGCSWKINQLEHKKTSVYSIKGYAFRDPTPLAANEKEGVGRSCAENEVADMDPLRSSSDSDSEVVDSDME